MIGAILTSDPVASAVKATPPLFVSVTWKLAGVDWSQTVLVLTALYTVLQISFLLWDRFSKRKRKG